MVAKLLHPADVGAFGLALAVTTPVIFFANLNLRAVVSTDINQKHGFADYLVVRVIALMIAAVAVVVSTVMMGPTPERIAIFSAVFVSKAFDSLSDLSYGELQRNHRLTRIGWSRLYQGFSQLVCFGIAVYYTRDLRVGLAVLAGLSAAVTLLYDFPGTLGRQIASNDGKPVVEKDAFRRVFLPILAISWPLGIVYFLDQIVINVPRYVLDGKHGADAVGYYSALAYFLVAGSTIVSGVTEASRSRLAAAWISNRPSFWSLLKRVSLTSAVVGAALTFGALVAGRPLLNLVYSKAYAEYTPSLIVLMFSGLFWFIATSGSAGLTAALRFKTQIPIYVFSVMVTLAAAYLLIPGQGVMGASLSLLAGMVARVIATGFAGTMIIKAEARALAATSS